MAGRGESRPLTYAEALASAVDANPALQRARLSEGQSQADWKAAWGGYDPTYELGGTWRSSNDRGFFQGFPYESESGMVDVDTSLSGTAPTGTTYSASMGLERNQSTFTTNFGGFLNEQRTDTYRGSLGLSLTQQLLRGVRLKYNLQNVTRSRNAWESAQLSTERTRQETLANAAEAYWGWLYQVQLDTIARDSVAVAEEALRVGRLKVQAGELAPVEETRLEAAMVQAQSAEIDAENAEITARNSLLLLLGLPPGEALEPATEVGLVPELQIDEARAVEVALAQNLDLLVAERGLQIAEYESDNARHGLLPSLAATVTVGSASQVAQQLDEDGEVVEPGPDTSFVQGNAGDALSNLLTDPLPSYAVGGTFSVPLGNRVARSERDRSELAVQMQQVDLAELRRAVTSQVQQQVASLESARRKVDLADSNLRLAEETLAAEEALAEAGRAIQKDVLEARTELDRSRADAAKARTDYRLAQVELLRLQGQLTEQAP